MCCNAEKDMLQCGLGHEGMAMAGPENVSANRLKRQAAQCRALAGQTHDEDGRRRYLRLEQMYLQLAEEERGGGPETGGIKPAA
jgi:hypothetical protein